MGSNRKITHKHIDIPYVTSIHNMHELNVSGDGAMTDANRSDYQFENTAMALTKRETEKESLCHRYRIVTRIASL